MSNPLSSITDIENTTEIIDFLSKIAVNNTVLFTNGNNSYISSVVKNLLKSYELVESSSRPFGVFCSDFLGYETAVRNGMNACFVNIPELKINDPSSDGSAGREFYMRLCFVKIILIKFILDLGYNILYIDPDMAFSQKCLSELLNISNEITFAKSIPTNGRIFINSNIIRAYPTCSVRKLFDFRISRNLQTYLSLLPDVSDETFLQHNSQTIPITISSLNSLHYPSGADSKNCDKNGIKMYHANCIVGLSNKIEYLKNNNVWFISES